MLSTFLHSEKNKAIASFPYTPSLNYTIQWIAYQQGTPIHYDTYITSLGEMLLMVTPSGICGLHFLVAPLDHYLAIAAKHFGQYPTHGIPSTAPWWSRIMQKSHVHRLVVAGTPFQQKVWNALCSVPPGYTTSYQAVAKSMGIPKSVRAIANSIGKNNIAILIPCHRVLRKNGQLGGYRWGITLKQALLHQEQEQITKRSHTGTPLCLT